MKITLKKSFQSPWRELVYFPFIALSFFANFCGCDSDDRLWQQFHSAVSQDGLRQGSGSDDGGVRERAVRA